MAVPSLTEDEVVTLSRKLLDLDPVAIERVPVGFGNESWRLDLDPGAVVLKVGPPSSAGKWTSARLGHDLAASVGVPVPRLVHFSVRADLVVRAFEWIDGTTAPALRDDPVASARLGADLGAAIAALHTIERPGFSSRLDDSAPSFPTWAAYLDHRLGQIRARARTTAAVDEATLARATAVVSDLALEVGQRARPTVCHRDLHPDNLVVDDEGRLRAILDWDMAEAWDPAGESFKLDWMLFPVLPGSREAFETAYASVHPDRPDWGRRERLVDVIESLNAVANAATQGWTSFGTDARARLDRLLDEP